MITEDHISFSTQTDLELHVEDLLGSEGSRNLANVMAARISQKAHDAGLRYNENWLSIWPDDREWLTLIDDKIATEAGRKGSFRPRGHTTESGMYHQQCK